MSQYRKYAVEDQEIRQLLDNYREGEPLKPRFSLNLPDCSLVLDSPNSNNLLDTNEISWLQKFAEENDKMCNSNILEEREEGPEEAKDKDEMKFSFNQNYAFPQRDELRQRKEEPSRAQNHRDLGRSDKENQHKLARDTSAKQIYHQRSNQHLLKDIQNTTDQKKAVRTIEKSVGSIKRNKPPKLGAAQELKRELFKDQQIKEVAENISMYKLEEMTEKLNTILSKGKLETTAHYNLESERFKAAINQKLNQLAQDKILPDRKSAYKRDPISNQNQENQKVYASTPPILTNPKAIAAPSTGSIIGSLQCLFDMLDLTYTGKLTKTNCKIERIPEDFKFIFGSIFTRIKFKNLVCNKRQFVKLCQNTIKQIDSEEIVSSLCQLQPTKAEDNQNILKQIRDNESEEQEERVPMIDRNQSHYAKSSYSSQKDRKEIEPARKKSCYQINPISESNSKLTVDSRYDFSRDKASQNGSMEGYCKKSINESTLKQHKKGLDDLMKLSNKMENYLSTKMLSQHSGARYSRDESLRFDELVKHI